MDGRMRNWMSEGGWMDGWMGGRMRNWMSEGGWKDEKMDE